MKKECANVEDAGTLVMNSWAGEENIKTKCDMAIHYAGVRGSAGVGVIVGLGQLMTTVSKTEILSIDVWFTAKVEKVVQQTLC